MRLVGVLINVEGLGLQNWSCVAGSGEKRKGGEIWEGKNWRERYSGEVTNKGGEKKVKNVED